MPAPLLPEEHVTVEMDMDSKHTPGDWVYYASSREVCDEDGRLLAVVPAWLPQYRKEQDANGALFAAAPFMFEALKAHEEWERKEKQGPQYPEGVSRDNGGEAIWRAWWDEQLALCARAENLTRAAIAKAEGR